MVAPEDAKGLKIRGGSREMDMVLKAAGAAVLTMPSNEIYVGMQTGAVDAALTSSTSLISFKLEELAKHLTTGRGKSYWYMLEPLVISKEIFNSLTPAQQKMVDEVGADLEKFGIEGAKADDQEVARVYEKVGAKVHDMDASVVEKWTKIARETAWKDFADKGEEYARLLKLAEVGFCLKTEIFDPAVQQNPFAPPHAGLLDRALGLVNRILTTLSAIALVIAGGVLTYGMFVRYWLRIPTDWQDELTVFLLVGATFLSAGYIQFKRGHVGIDALAEICRRKPIVRGAGWRICSRSPSACSSAGRAGPWSRKRFTKDR